MLTIAVPEEAKVFVNGYLTKTTGTIRQYVSHGMQPGLSYNYVVRAEIYRNGQRYEQVRNVTLSAGTSSVVAIQFDAKSTERLASSR